MPRIRQKANEYRNADFSKEITAQLKYMGLQQHDLSEYLGVCDGTVSLMLKSPEKIPVDRLQKIITFCSLKPSVVLLFCGFTAKAIKN